MSVLLARRSAVRTERSVRHFETVLRETKKPIRLTPRLNDYAFDRARGLATAAVATTDVTFTIDNVTGTKGPTPLADPASTTETLTIQNTFKFQMDIGGIAFVEYHRVDEEWHAYQAECPFTEEPITAEPGEAGGPVSGMTEIAETLIGLADDVYIVDSDASP